MAEVEELKANPEAEASGVVIESKLDPGRGAVVTVLVNRGTMKVGDALVAGAHWGRVRALHDYRGRKVKEATPSEPVEVLGFDTVPEAGEYVRVVENDRRARQLANERGFRLKSEAQARRSQRTRSLETIFEDARGGVLQDLNLVLKADVSGSLEAFEDEIARLPQSEVQVQVVLSGVGGITESDIMLAAASDAIVLGFNVRPVGDARAAAEREGVEIRSYSVIYRAIDELRDAMQGMLAPEEVEEAVGTVEVRAIFRASQGRHDRRLLRHRRQGHARREVPPGARRHDRLRRRGRVAPARPGGRPRGGGRVRVRHRAAELRRHEGGRRDRGLRHEAGRAHACRQRASRSSSSSKSTSTSRTAVR